MNKGAEFDEKQGASGGHGAKENHSYFRFLENEPSQILNLLEATDILLSQAIETSNEGLLKRGLSSSRPTKIIIKPRLRKLSTSFDRRVTRYASGRRGLKIYIIDMHPHPRRLTKLFFSITSGGSDNPSP